MKKCPFCAEEIQDAAIVCKHCGRELTAPPSPTVVAAPPVLAGDSSQPEVKISSGTNTPTKSKRSKYWLYGGGALVVLYIIGRIVGPPAVPSTPVAQTTATAPVDQAAALAEARRRVAAVEAEEAQWKDATVELSTLIDAYKNNEVAADQRFKGQPIQVTGTVQDVKEGILGGPYVIVAPPGRSGLRAVQCFLAKTSANDAARLNKGDSVTVRGTVQGLMINVQVKPCEIR